MQVASGFGYPGQNLNSAVPLGGGTPGHLCRLPPRPVQIGSMAILARFHVLICSLICFRQHCNIYKIEMLVLGQNNS